VLLSGDILLHGPLVLISEDQPWWVLIDARLSVPSPASGTSEGATTQGLLPSALAIISEAPDQLAVAPCLPSRRPRIDVPYLPRRASVVYR
jgi:hypothetical protein